ncbi:MAG TPA: MBL fold metallo-hydrolase [Melioribacteraceae bacterium]|nr:MBL fold metallo-hydrolase [Melioribacteraceae bacterium]
MDNYLCVLGSTSAGNSTVIWNKDEAILVDCGFTVKYFDENLAKLNIKYSQLKGVLLTHLHNDHLNLAFLKKMHEFKIPVYVHLRKKKMIENRKDILKKMLKDNLVKAYENEEFNISGFKVKGFEVPHDVPGGCYGYNIFVKNDVSVKKVSIATDIGYSTETAEECFKNSDLMVIESNHDVVMLENSRRADWLKERIKNIGHLSNEQSAEFIGNVLKKSETLPSVIMLAHISQECNTPYLAATTMMNKLRSTNKNNIKVILTNKSILSEIVKI